MNPEPDTQGEVSQKEKSKYCILGESGITIHTLPRVKWTGGEKLPRSPGILARFSAMTSGVGWGTGGTLKGEGIYV